MCDSTSFHDIFDREDQRTVRTIPNQKHFENALNCQSSYHCENCQNCTNSRNNSDKLRFRWIGGHKFQKSKF